MAKKAKVKASEIGPTIEAWLDDFEVELNAQFKKDLNASGKYIVDELKEANPPGSGRYHDWDAYNAGWSKKTESKHFGEYKIVVYNKKKPGLTHLLEKGHLTPDGHGYVKAYPHIAPAAEKGFKDLERRLKK